MFHRGDPGLAKLLRQAPLPSLCAPCARAPAANTPGSFESPTPSEKAEQECTEDVDERAATRARGDANRIAH